MEIISWLNLNSGASQVILAAVLVGVTVWYTILTRHTIKVLEKQIDTDIKPVIAVGLFHVPERPNEENTFCVHSHLTNIGSGVAINILVEFSDLLTGGFVAKSVNSIDFLKPNGESSSHHIHLDKNSLQKLRYVEGHHGLAAELTCTVNFEDVRGRKYKTQQMVYFTKGDRKIAPEPGTLKLLEA